MNLRMRVDRQRELENKRKYDWLKGRETTMISFRSDVYRVGQAVLEKEYERNLKFWDKHIEKANGGN
jgi:hypothetical protein